MFGSVTTNIAILGGLWAALVILAFRFLISQRFDSVGLSLAFVLNMSLMHVGGLVHAVEGYDHRLNSYLITWNYTRETVFLGFGASLIGLLAFVFGTILAGRVFGRPWVPVVATTHRFRLLLWRGSLLLVVVGVGTLVLEIVFAALNISFPGMAAILGGARNAIIVGSCGLVLYFAMRQRYNISWVIALTAISGLPIYTMITTGIIADAVPSSIVLVSFCLVFFRPNGFFIIRSIAVFLVALYAMVIASVMWLEIRPALRQAVAWGAGYSERLNIVIDRLTKVTLFDGRNRTHLGLIDARMNHSVTVGKAIEQLAASPEEFENGRSIGLALAGWVPRVIWPNKPERGGSNFVDMHINKSTASNTSLASGPVFEGFVNFGYSGVIGLMLFIGIFIRYLDIRAAQMLVEGNIVRAVPAFLAAIPMITTSNTMFFIVNGVVSSWIVGILIWRYWRVQIHRHIAHNTLQTTHA